MVVVARAPLSQWPPEEIVMARHVVVGKGPVGTATAQLLAERGHEVLVLSRSGGRSTELVEHRAVDASDAAALQAAGGRADALYNAVNPPAYDRWTQDWPPIAAALLAAAERSGALLVTMGNLYVDRKSVAEGKSVDLGGRRTIKKKKPRS